jgi:hypothetical protein
MVSKSFPWLAGGVASEERIHPPLALAESAAELLAWGGIIGSCGDSYGFASGRVRRKQRRKSEPFAKPLAPTLKAKGGLFWVMVFSYPVVPFGWGLLQHGPQFRAGVFGHLSRAFQNLVFLEGVLSRFAGA